MVFERIGPLRVGRQRQSGCCQRSPEKKVGRGGQGCRKQAEAASSGGEGRGFLNVAAVSDEEKETTAPLSIEGRKQKGALSERNWSEVQQDSPTEPGWTNRGEAVSSPCKIGEDIRDRTRTAGGIQFREKPKGKSVPRVGKKINKDEKKRTSGFCDESSKAAALPQNWAGWENGPSSRKGGGEGHQNNDPNHEIKMGRWNWC